MEWKEKKKKIWKSLLLQVRIVTTFLNSSLGLADNAGKLVEKKKAEVWS